MRESERARERERERRGETTFIRNATQNGVHIVTIVNILGTRVTDLSEFLDRTHLYREHICSKRKHSMVWEGY